MRSTAPIVLATLLALAAGAAAHVTTTVDPVDAPLVVGQPTVVDVHFSEPCFEVLPQQAQGQDTISSGLLPEVPDSFAWVGENVPFSMDQCDPTAVPLALVRATAKLTITPSAQAPGLTNITLPVTSYLGGGSEPGDAVDLVVQIAYFANATVKVGPIAGTGATVLLPVTLSYTANAPTTLTLAATATSGTVTGLPATTALASSVDLNQTVVTRTFNATFASAGAPSTVTVTATLAPNAGGAGLPFVATLALPALGGNSTDGHDDHDHTHSEEPKKTPLPLPVLLVAVGAALAVARRRIA